MTLHILYLSHASVSLVREACLRRQKNGKKLGNRCRIQLLQRAEDILTLGILYSLQRHKSMLNPHTCIPKKVTRFRAVILKTDPGCGIVHATPNT